MTRNKLIEKMARAILRDYEDGANMSTHPVPERAATRHALAALAAIEAAGLRLVPVVASRHMLVAAHMAERDDIELTEDEHRAMYAAFLAASPYAPPAAQHEDAQ